MPAARQLVYARLPATAAPQAISALADATGAAAFVTADTCVDVLALETSAQTHGSSLASSAEVTPTRVRLDEGDTGAPEGYMPVAGPMARQLLDDDAVAAPSTPGATPSRTVVVMIGLVATSDEAADALVKMANTLPVDRLGYSPELGVATWGLFRTHRQFLWMHVCHIAPTSQQQQPVLSSPPFFMGMASVDESSVRVLDAGPGDALSGATAKLAVGLLPRPWRAV